MTKEKKGNRAKIFLLVLVSVAFVIVGYFRFFYNKTKAVAVQAPKAVSMEQPSFSGVKVDIPQNARKVVATEMEIVRSVIRDIFSPEEPTPRKQMQSSAPRAAPQPPSFRLGGTIVGGRKPMAIINDEFVEVGQRIGGYRVVHIGKDDVVLESGDKKIVLEMVKE
ncbi:hypothetical protein ACFL7E_06280 [Thermodesulfobacteriota bacterium]